MQILLKTPPDFQYAATMGSHGWRRLAPFSYDDTTRILTRIERLDDGTLVKLSLQEAEDNNALIHVDGVHDLSAAQQARIETRVSRWLSLHWDLSAFYAFIQAQAPPEYQWIIEQGAGRMLVCSTVWEDMAKTLLTTNTTWAQTIAMCGRLCELGAAYPGGGHAFPSAEQVAALSLDTFAKQIRAGYRAPYLHALAQQIAAGELDVESWFSDDINSADLYKAIKSLKGFGDYAAGTMLRLLGHFDQVAIDTACRAGYRRVTGSDSADDAAIKQYYAAFGDWRGLVAWMDVMRR